MISEKFERGGEDGGILQPRAQGIGIKPGEVKKPPRPILAREHPAERSQRQRLRV